MVSLYEQALVANSRNSHVSADAYEDLQLFVAQVTELRHSRFGKKVLSQDKVSLRSGATMADVEFVNVDEEEFRSFLLGCRLLIQNNERISISNIWNTCKKLMGDSPHFVAINAQRWILNDYLDREAAIANHTGTAVTNREIMDTFLYGRYAHLDKTHAARLKQWQREPRQFYPLKLMFILGLKVLFQTSGTIRDEIRNWLEKQSWGA